MSGGHKKSSKKHKKHHKKQKKHKRSVSSSESESEWVEKSTNNVQSDNIEQNISKDSKQPQRDDWLDASQLYLTASTSERKVERSLEKSRKRLEEQYDPSKCSKELNPYWKNGGTGLPSFKKPSDSIDSTDQPNREKTYSWKKNKSNYDTKNETDNEQEKVLNEVSCGRTIVDDSLNPNLIAAKLVKAEIMGNTKLIAELKIKLEEARQAKSKDEFANKEVLLTQTDSKGYSKPVKIAEDNYNVQKKKRKIETHSGNERTSYYADDDKYSLKEMFEAEKYNSADKSNREFAKIAENIKKNDNLADLFVDKIRHQPTNSKDVDNAINEHQKVSKYLDICSKCLQSEKMLKHLIIEYNDTCYLTVPDFEPLVDGHCLISPIKHVSCSVQLDENEWSEINNIRRKLCRLFEEERKTVIFFEIARKFNKYPHMVLECIPIPFNKGDLAPIYFKKAIEESESEWSHNKKLIHMKDRDVRKTIPKGLPYFFVSFGMKEGFAHVIEDHSKFPSNFAQEIIGGMLDVHHSKWRKPKRDGFDAQILRVKHLKNIWNKVSS